MGFLPKLIFEVRRRAKVFGDDILPRSTGRGKFKTALLIVRAKTVDEQHY
jgi:hypothetical protein